MKIYTRSFLLLISRFGLTQTGKPLNNDGACLRKGPSRFGKLRIVNPIFGAVIQGDEVTIE